jgi:hypothetical protein
MARKAKEKKKRTYYTFIDLDELDNSRDFERAKVIEAGGFTPLQARRWAEMKCGFELPSGRFFPIPIGLWRRMCEMPKPHRLTDVPEFARPKEVPKKELPKPLQLTPSPGPTMKKAPKFRRRRRILKIRTNPNQIPLFPK